MPITALGQTVSDAVADDRLDLRETRKVVVKLGTRVSNPEARKVGDLYASLGKDGDVYGTRGAKNRLEQLFVDANLPFGKNEAQIRTALANHFDSVTLGPKMTSAPRVSSYLQVTLRDARPVDGTRETVFFTASTRKAYLRVDGGGRANPEPRWHGPFDLRAVAPAPSINGAAPVLPGPVTDPAAKDGRVSDMTHKRARTIYFDAAFGEHHNWHAGSPAEKLHKDPRTVSSDIEAWYVTPKRADGTWADPDQADQVYFRGYGGQWSGPHPIEPLFDR